MFNVPTAGDVPPLANGVDDNAVLRGVFHFAAVDGDGHGASEAGGGEGGLGLFAGGEGVLLGADDSDFFHNFSLSAPFGAPSWTAYPFALEHISVGLLPTEGRTFC